MSQKMISQEAMKTQILKLRELADSARDENEVRALISKIAQLTRAYRIQHNIGIAPDPVSQAMEIDSSYINRSHTQYLSDAIADAVRDVERGFERRMVVSLPPRSGKSTLTSKYAPLWMLRRHPEWSIMLTSYSGNLAAGWARDLRRIIEDHPELGIALKRDAGAGGRWNTIEGGGVYATGIGGDLTGRGARVMLIDDPIADFVAAHSPRIRDNLWNWWLAVARTRLEPPSLVLVTQTRWHEDDFTGRLLSNEYEGNPKDWTQVTIPAVADSENDPLGREIGAPLLSPLIPKETIELAELRWKATRGDVGEYTWAALYQQRPSPQQGAIFDAGWWRFWTSDPSKATEDGRVVYIEPDGFREGRWLDSWDTTFKGDGGDYVVGQRWVRSGANRFLVAQLRGRWSFTQTIEKMKQWAITDDQSISPFGMHVHERFIEDSANGPAIISTLRNEISGLKPVRPTSSKEARARAITPEIESGNVLLPHPTDLGMSWVQDLLSELRNFPNAANDDQVDALTQALSQLRDGGIGLITVPGSQTGRGSRRVNRGMPSTSVAGSRRFNR